MPIRVIPRGVFPALSRVAEGVFIYKVNAEGKLVSLRAIWEFDKMMASLTPG